MASTLLTGLVSYYKFQGNSNDELGTNNGTDTATITYSTGNGKIGQGAGFDGVTGKIQFATGITVPTNATIACWFKDSALENVAQEEIFGLTHLNDNPAFNMTIYSGTARAELVDSNNNFSSVNFGSSMNDGVWRHIVAVKTGDSIEAFTNAVSQGTASIVKTGNYASTTLIAANGLDGGLIHFGGAIDEAGYWNVALTAQQIGQLYNFGNGNQYSFTQPFGLHF